MIGPTTPSTCHLSNWYLRIDVDLRHSLSCLAPAKVSQECPWPVSLAGGVLVIFHRREPYKLARRTRDNGDTLWSASELRPLVGSGIPVSTGRPAGRGFRRAGEGGKIEGRVRRKLMRLLSFVPCGCRAGPIDDAPPADQLQQQQAAATCRDGGAAARRRRRRARSLGGSPQWRPALGDIYEGVAVDAAGKAATAGGRVVPARPGAARVLPRAHSREFRHIETASSMPAFAPTAFLF